MKHTDIKQEQQHCPLQQDADLHHQDKSAIDTSEEKRPTTAADLLYVLLIVAVICGSNGGGMIAAGLHWRATHDLGGALLILVGVTVFAILVVVGIVILRKFYFQKKQ